MKFAIFETNKTPFAIEATGVIEIKHGKGLDKKRELTNGNTILNFRNQVISLFSLNQLLFSGSKDFENIHEKVILVIEKNKQFVGIIVDSLPTITDIEEKKIQNSSEIDAIKSENKYIQFNFTYNNQIVQIIETQNL